jgi:predicted MFS family arabinose efflux permease
MMFCNHSTYAFHSFFPTIIKDLGLGGKRFSLNHSVAPYGVAACGALLTAWVSDRKRERGICVSVPLLLAIVGFAMSLANVSAKARFAASFFYATGSFSANAIVFSWAANTLNESPEKRAGCLAIINGE